MNIFYILTPYSYIKNMKSKLLKISLRILAVLLLLLGGISTGLAYRAFAAGIGEVGGKGVDIALSFFIGGIALMVLNVLILLFTVPKKIYKTIFAGIGNSLSPLQFILDIRGKNDRHDDPERAKRVSNELWTVTIILFIWTLPNGLGLFLDDLAGAILAIPIISFSQHNRVLAWYLTPLYCTLFFFQGRWIQKKVTRFRNYSYIYVIQLLVNSAVVLGCYFILYSFGIVQ